MWTFAETFVVMFITDMLYTYYLRSVKEDMPIRASFWAASVTLCAAIAAINYVEDHRMLIASLLGAFCGTYFGMRYQKK